MNVLADRELLDLLEDRPELAAVAEAVAATQGESKWLRVTKSRIAGAAVAVAAVSLLALLAPWQAQRGPNVVERALAAVSRGPVIHAVVEYSRPEEAVVEIATGRSRPRVHRTEYWYDSERRLLRTRLSTDGAKLTEIVETPEHAWSDLGDWPTGRDYTPRLEPALAPFVTGYRAALDRGDAEVVGETRVEGREAKLLRFPRGAGERMIVAVDADSYVPLRFHSEYPGGRRSPEWRVVTIESLPRDPAYFERPELSAPRGTGGSVSAGREISLAEARELLGVAPVWLGPEFAGQRVESVQVQTARVTLTNGGGEVEGHIVRIEYEHGLRVSQAVDLGGRYALGFDDGGDPAPPAGSMAIVGDHLRNWQGELEVGRLAVVLDAASALRLLEAAKALRPLS